MRHNKIIGWEGFLEVVERVQKMSPWLSRQIAKRASEWPFWLSGAEIVDWNNQQAWVRLPMNFRNSIEGELSHGHLILAGELALRLVLLRHRQEFPFRYRIVSSHLETHHAVDQTVDIKFALDFTDWERIRLELARDSRSVAEFAFSAALADGRLAGMFTVQTAFDLDKFLPA
jgi:hypothetical protein